MELVSSARREQWKIAPETPVQYLKGVGEGRAALLGAAGYATAGELLYCLPLRYEDRRHPVRIADIRSVRSPVLLRGRIASTSGRPSPVRRLPIFQAVLDDGSGSIVLVWFNQPWLAEKIRRGDQVAIFGVPAMGRQGHIQIESPDWEILDPSGESQDEGAIVPIYPKIATVQPRVMRSILTQALQSLAGLRDPLPESIRNRLGVIPIAEAIFRLHCPDEITPDLIDGTSPAHRRLVVQEFFAFQLALRLRRLREEKGKSKPRRITVTDEIRARAREILPFRLTSAQKRVLGEIVADLETERPMYRLLQGDVGSGKTIVALLAALLVIENGHQAAILAPTAILAQQHAQKIRELVDSRLRVALLTGATPPSERKLLLPALRHGEIDLLVGTHALLEKPVEFRSLGLAVIDEQHRFGVTQRRKLFEKGAATDILVMTATPIPRSLAIAVHGDLELSVIDELPPGRQPVRTVVRGTGRLPKVWEFVAGELEDGAQAYIVYPIIEESEKLDLKPLVAGAESVRKAFPDRRVGVLHGRMSPAEKDETMGRFKAGEIDILVSTTVVEVGIDVANASVMVILDADRFGLSQLHQLRGRVGRGSRKSWCVVLRDEKSSETAKTRLRMFEATADGFEVAQKDLELRGPGDFFGTRQSGAPGFRFGHILRDFRLMDLARDVAIEAAEQGRFGNPAELAKSLLGGEPQRLRD
ncbi:MAG: ATP-dependent DNA helicase RecG [Thermoanaerobaculia bacterium]